ncbi:MAG: hypothetical protein JWO71_1927 [Candidatus Acidoferrum typicum]|nr:hypothetical protein [Candidatus Acidoferrum typicum]
MNDLGLFTQSVWAVTAVVQALLLCLLLARKNVSSYPAFSAYIFMTLAQSGLLFMAIKGWGFSSTVAWRVGWATQCVVLGARAFAVAELCRHVLGRFLGVWTSARWILLGSGTAVLLYALIAASHQWRLVLNTAELGLELATAAVIVMLLLFARYYDVAVDPQLRLLALGLCLYSCASALNDAVLERWLDRYVTLWNVFGMAAFLACLLLWSWAFRKPAPQTVAAPLFSSGSVYLNIIPEMNSRLRSLNEQLIEFWRPEAPRT